MNEKGLMPSVTRGVLTGNCLGSKSLKTSGILKETNESWHS